MSKNRNGLSTNTKIQIAECQDELRWYADEHNVTVETVAIFDEDDVSASRYSKKPRPKYEHMLDLIRAHKVDQVWSTESERLLRRPEEMGTLIDLAESSDLKELRFTDGDGYNLTTPDGIYSARAAANRAERESRKISVRTKRKQADNARNGKAHGGHRPYGYDKTGMALDIAEATILRQMAALIVSGSSCHDVADWLNTQGHTTTYGKPWLPVTVRNTLRRVRYAGIREHLGAQYPAAWPAVFDRETWDRLQLAMRVSRERYKGRAPATKYQNTGLLICGGCGVKLNGETKRDRPGAPLRPVYVCRQRRGVTRNAVALDHFLREAIIFRLDSPALAKLLVHQDAPNDDLNKLLSERQAQSLIVDGLVDDYATGLRPPELGWRSRLRSARALRLF